MDEDEILNDSWQRPFNPSAKKYQSPVAGRIITSRRKFGIELELSANSSAQRETMARSIPGSFGCEHDGSIESNFGVEVVSPPMSGSGGELGIDKVCVAASANGLTTNRSCGLHVHLDGEGFRSVDSAIIGPLKDATSLFDKIHKGDIVFTMPSAHFAKYTQMARMSNERAAESLANCIFSAETTRDNDSDIIELTEAVGTSSRYELYKTRATIDVDGTHVSVYRLVDIHEMPDPTITDLTQDDFEPSKDDLLCAVKMNKCLENAKTLLYAYHAIDDVLMAMLPESRRNNVYCQSLRVAVSPAEIESIQSYQDLEKVWYRAKDNRALAYSKNEKHDNSRYYSINLHSLFRAYRTVEIRSHAATLSQEKIMMWVALHQQILDMIADGKVTIDHLRHFNFTSGLDEKISLFFSTFDINEQLQRYVTNRVNYFTKNIK